MIKMIDDQFYKKLSGQPGDDYFYKKLSKQPQYLLPYVACYLLDLDTYLQCILKCNNTLQPLINKEEASC